MLVILLTVSRELLIANFSQTPAFIADESSLEQSIAAKIKHTRKASSE